MYSSDLIIDDVEAVCRLLLCLPFGADIGFLDLHIVFGGQPSDSFRVRILLVFHDETDGIPAFPATETLIDLFGGGDGERGGLFIVEGAESEVVRPPFLQFHKTSHDLHDIDPVLNLFYGALTDQGFLDNGV